MSCDEVRDLVLDHAVRRLAPPIERLVEAHLATCAACARADGAERELTELLATRLPRATAPPALVRRIARLDHGAPGSSAVRAWSARRAWIAAAIGAAAGLVAAGVVWTATGVGRGVGALGVEAVDDHLRILMAQHPLEIESGGVHQVKPWFEGRLDFAPVVPDLSRLGLTLRGGAVGYFHDRRAAVLQYQLRAHLVTLLAFRSDGLALAPAPRLAPPDRGFRAVLWRAGPLGYALVADVNPGELERVAAEAARATSF